MSKDDVPDSYVRNCIIATEGRGCFVWPNGTSGPVYAQLDGCAVISLSTYERLLAAHEQASKDAPRLLTESEWRKLLCIPLVEDALAVIRERGLILPEPVDAIDRLRDTIEALHGISFDRDKMKHIVNRAGVTLDCGGE